MAHSDRLRIESPPRRTSRWRPDCGGMVLALVFVCASGMEPARTAEAEASGEVVERMRAAIQYELESKQLPSLAIALVTDDEIVWAEGFGFQDEDRQQPATPETVYRVGSVSKLFTDLAAMRLVEAGELDLDAPVIQYFPEFAPRDPRAGKISLRQLMTHRAGLVRESPVGNYFDPTEPSLAATVASLNDTALVYPPGTRTKYSNAGIAVVGAVVERQAGTEFSHHIRRTLLEPLAMRDSGFEVDERWNDKRATGWMWTYDGRRFVAPDFALGTAPAGNLYASVADLGKFMVAVLNDLQAPAGRLLGADLWRQMTHAGADTDSRPLDFGIGFHVQQFDGHRKIGHGGAVYGFSTQFEALPDAGIGVVAVSSLDGSNGVLQRLTDHALRLLLAEQQGQPLPDYATTVAIPTARVAALVGRYQSPEGSGDAFAEITADAGRVWLKRGTFRNELRAAASDGALLVDDVFHYGTAVSRLEDGGVRIGDRRYERRDDAPPEPAAERWRGLIGEYGWDHNTLYILEDEGQLVALIEWFYRYPLTEVDEDTFAFPDYGLYHGERLEFSRDAAGEATAVTAAEVRFARRDVGTRAGETFKITPVRPIDALRGEALAAAPPPESGDFRAADLVELTSLDPTIRLDIRYATTNNFTGAVFYRQPRAFMQRPAAEAVVAAHRELNQRGLGLLIHDAYRPWHVTKMFWDATPDTLKDFVANPANGSRHNRGCAVDLTLYDLRTGEPIPMVAGYDEFSPRSFPEYPGGTARQRWYRGLLRRTMEAHGFTVYEFEWWHFDFADWRKYRIGNATFEELLEPTDDDSDAKADGASGDFRIERSVVRRGYDGTRCWVHARAGVIPASDPSEPHRCVLTTQPLLLTGSDVFYALHTSQSTDAGQSWSPLQEQDVFRRRNVDDRTEMTVCDFTPQWHAASRKLLGIGQTVWYRDNRVMSVRPRATAYAVFDPSHGTWSPWKRLKMPDLPEFENCGAGSVQRLDLPDGDILLPVYFKRPDQRQYSVTVCRCRFDGSELTYLEHGDVMTVDVQRGFAEPSLTKFGDRYYLTLRNDEHGYVTSGADGLHFDQPKPWRFDDGTDLGNYNTQQHWVTHASGLFLVYTRRGAENDHVFRHRAPLFIARVDPQALMVQRHTERVLVPERGARLGNFGVCQVTEDETWVVVSEWMQKKGPDHVLPVDNPLGADNSIYLARLLWGPPSDASR